MAQLSKVEAQEGGTGGSAGIVGRNGLEAEGFVESASGGHGGESIEVDGAVTGGASGVDGGFGEQPAKIVTAGSGADIEAFEFGDVDGMRAEGDAAKEFAVLAREEEGTEGFRVGAGEIGDFGLEILVVEVDGESVGVFLDEFTYGSNFFRGARADDLDVHGRGSFHRCLVSL